MAISPSSDPGTGIADPINQDALAAATRATRVAATAATHAAVNQAHTQEHPARQ
jgi:hypothetical protein